MTDTVAIIGAGLIGRAWAIVFARAGVQVRLHDIDPDGLDRARRAIAVSLDDLRACDLVPEVKTVEARISYHSTLADALAGATYAQECGPEKVDAKAKIFSAMEDAAAPGTILASSTSGIVASQFTNHLARPEDCLVAHPVNPPSLVPLVEIAPSPSTGERAVETTMALMHQIGQTPILVRREIDGFILNRLQGALLTEALRLYRDGYASAEDIDKAVRDGLGRRWAFMGPLETIDLNAPGGAGDYATRYGPIYAAADAERGESPWQDDVIGRLVAELRTMRPATKLPERQEWRDRRLMALTAHLSTARDEIGP